MNKNTVKIRLMENKTIVEFIMGELFIFDSNQFSPSKAVINLERSI